MTNFLDSVEAGQPRRTSDGYLVADVRAARTGIQLYAGHEVGRPDLEVVRVYRPESEVFHKDSLSSYAYKPAVNGHPPEAVSAENWKDYATGQIGGDVVRDGDHVRVPLILMDGKAIADYDSGKRELSMGYSAKIEFGDGITPEGDAYDAIQKDIRINHISQEVRGRAGTAKIGDSINWGIAPVTDHKPGGMPNTEKGGLMADSLKTVVLGDAAVQVSVSDVAAIEQFKTNSAKALSDAKAEHKTAIDAKDAELAKLQAKLDDAEGKVLSAEDVDKLVADRSDLLTAAKSIAPEVKTEGLKDAEIRKAVVVAKLGDAAVADKSEAYIDARFDILVESASKENPVRDAINSNAHSHVYNDTEFGDAHNDYVARLTRRNRKESK